MGEKVVQDIRARKELSDDLCKSVTGYPFVDHLRRALKSDDLPHVIQVCESVKTLQKHLGFALLQAFADSKKVEDYLVGLWKKAGSGYREKRLLLWRILDIPNLAKEVHEDVYRFVKGHWEEFVADSGNWVHGDILDYREERLADDAFPGSKSWIYLLLASLSEHKEEARKLLAKYVNSEVSINAAVAQEIFTEAEDTWYFL